MKTLDAMAFRSNNTRRICLIAADRILEGSQVAKTDEGIIEYSTAGKGSPVLFIHGAGSGHFLVGIHQKCRKIFAGFLKTIYKKDSIRR